MGWSKVITIEKGNLAGQKMASGDFSGNLPFLNYSDNYSWFPQVSGATHKYNEYVGLDIPNFPTYITQTLGNGTHFIAGIRTSAKDPDHPLAGSFIDITFAIRDVSISGDTWSAFISIQICKRVYADDGHVQSTTYPLGNYFPDGTYIVKRPSAEEAQFPWTVFNNCKILCGKLTHDGVDHLVVGLMFGHPDGNAECSNYQACRMKQSYFQSSGGWGEDAILPDGEEYSPEFGPASEPDGYGQGGVIGSHDKHSDHVGIPTKPQYGFTSAGFLNHYRISAQGLSMLGEALFPEPSGASVDVAAGIDKLITTMWNSRIIDYIIDCRIIPVVAPATNMKDITCGGKKLIHPSSLLPYSAYLVDEDFVDVDCGVISTPLTEGNFVDFITRAKVFIPFYGFVDLAPEYWHGAKIGLYYRFNLMDGSFMAWLTSAPFRSELESAGDMEIIGQYAGNACIHLPINSQSYSQIIGGMITTGAAIVGAAAAGSIGGAVGGKAGAAAVRSAEIGMTQSAISGAADIASGRPQLINNNSYNGSAALMSCRTPYLLIEFAETQFSTKYVEENGLPAVINRVLGTLSGFTTCVNPIIDFACEQEEAEEIRNLLRSGVIL